jgi:MFS transporter, DHA3 family, macrolide efflux protein
LNQAVPTKLWNKNFALLWQGQLVSLLGTQGFLVAELLWLRSVSSSGQVVGLALMISTFPAVIFNLLGGTFADRYSRKLLIVLCDLVAAILVLTLAILFFYLPATQDSFNLIVILVVISTFVNSVQAIYRPAVLASIPDLVPPKQLTAANSLVESISQLAIAVGQAMGGVLFRILGAPLLFLLDGVSYLLSAISEMFIMFPKQIDRQDCRSGCEANKQDQEQDSVWQELRAGLRYVYQNPGMRTLFICLATMNLIFAPISIFLSYYVEYHLQLSVDWFGYLFAALSLGILSGLTIASWLNWAGIARRRLILVSFLVMFGSYLLIGIQTHSYLSWGLLYLTGVAVGLVNINIITILQSSSDAKYLGRVMGVLSTMATLFVPLGMGLSGIIIEQIGAHRIGDLFVYSGLILFIVIALSTLNKNFRDYLSY